MARHVEPWTLERQLIDDGYNPDRPPIPPATEQRTIDRTEPTLVVVVVSSFSWFNIEAVWSELDRIKADHGYPPIQIVTSGMESGAEKAAVAWANEYGQHSVVIRDENLEQLKGAIVLGFIDESSEAEGAPKLLAHLRRFMWVRTLTTSVSRVPSSWADR